jgi:hypothetical protein
MMMRIFAILAVLAIAACQSRQADPVQLSQPEDKKLACQEIAQLQTANRLQAAKLANLDEGVAIGNAIALTLSKVWFWPAIMGVDLSDAEEIEARALRDRNRRLTEIARSKHCVETATVPEADSQPT